MSAEGINRVGGEGADAQGCESVWQDTWREHGPAARLGRHAAPPPVQPLHPHWIPAHPLRLGQCTQSLLPAQRDHQHHHSRQVLARTVPGAATHLSISLRHYTYTINSITNG